MVAVFEGIRGDRASRPEHTGWTSSSFIGQVLAQQIMPENGSKSVAKCGRFGSHVDGSVMEIPTLGIQRPLVKGNGWT
jgi:hypothetical protein